MTNVVVLDDWEGVWTRSAQTDRLRARASLAISPDGVEGCGRPGPADRESLGALLRDADVLVLNRERTRVDDDLLCRTPRLRAVFNTGTGLNHVDHDAVARRGIVVRATGGDSWPSVVEQTFALMLGCVKRVPELDGATRAGRFPRLLLTELYGARLGLAGLGQIGSRVVRVAQAFGMSVHAWSRSLTEGQAQFLGVIRAPTLVDLAGAVDVLSLHLRLTPETVGIVGREVFDALHPGAILINTARAGLVDEEALSRRLRRSDLLVGLDVFPTEPAPPGSPVRDAPGVLSPHVGWMTYGTWDRYVAACVDQIMTWLDDDERRHRERT